ncbi:hypothetical protein E2C01_099414 [Portunus trituberculatus]|uniref:Uncharacterized protein n=1 Tax=Portunus trituberculatus TaxID=210409 RepID=A0A5B7K3S0_PORTR|nr:hypothetical protein [Portunus trituberculatus]
MGKGAAQVEGGGRSTVTGWLGSLHRPGPTFVMLEDLQFILLQVRDAQRYRITDFFAVGIICIVYSTSLPNNCVLSSSRTVSCFRTLVTQHDTGLEWCGW